MTGQIVGGWEYVWGAYGVTAFVLAFYATSIFVRLRNVPDDDRETPA